MEVLRDVFYIACTAASGALWALLAIARMSQLVTLAVSGLLILAGVAQLLRANDRLHDQRYLKMHRLIRAEAGGGRLWIAVGIELGVLGWFVHSPLLIAAVGASASAILFIRGIAGGARSAEAESLLGLSQGSAAKECWRVQAWAKIAASARLIPGTGCFVRLANYEVPAGQIGLLQTLILAVIVCTFWAYVTVGLAAVVARVAHHGARDPLGKQHGHPKDPEGRHDGGEGAGEPAPTYADLCPAIPDPLAIGHGLGELFRRDSAPKAGCGSRAIAVPSTGAWVSAGICSGELRSVAVSGAASQAVILYGEPARFAWTAALEGKLVEAETAEPAGGNVDLVETRAGSYAFTRPSPSISPGREDLRRCSEASGVARPFARLAPPLALLWVQLLRYRAEWSWPVGNTADGENPLAFLDYPSGKVTADGGCEEDTSCHLDVDGKSWPGEGTGFVSMAELEPYMPSSK